MKRISNNDGASRTSRQKNDRIEKTLQKYRKITQVVPPVTEKVLRITPLGGQNGIGEKDNLAQEQWSFVH